jgi:hypothetical protein
MFSPLENKILKVLGHRKLTILEITRLVHEHKRQPFGANNGIGFAIRKINKKCKYHKLNWFLNGMGYGRGGRTVWRDK